MKKKSTNQNYAVLATLEGGAAAKLDAKRVLLCGEAVFATLTPNASPPSKGFIEQPARETTSGFFSQFERATTARLNLWADERLLNLKKLRFAFAVDGYLAWGRRNKRKGTVVLFGGASSERATNIEIMVFLDGRLVGIEEKVLPGVKEPAFIDMRETLLSELRHRQPTARFVQAAPLQDWGIPGVEYIGADEALKGLSFRPITRLAKRGSALLVPGLIAGTGVLAYIGLLLTGWDAYSSAGEAYKAAMQDPAIHEKGGIDTNFLNTMNSRRIYMDTPRRQGLLVNKAAQVMRGLAEVDHVKVLELKLPAPSVNPQGGAGVAISLDTDKRQIHADRSPDVWISLSVPKSSSPALTQGKHEVLEAIAKNTGMSVRIAQQGISEDKGQRIYNIEGFFHD